MRVKNVFTTLVVLAFVCVGNSYADQKIKTKSNIKNDRVMQLVASSECTEACAEGERCVKPLASDAAAKEEAKSYCVAVSEEKSSVMSKENP